MPQDHQMPEDISARHQQEQQPENGPAKASQPSAAENSGTNTQPDKHTNDQAGSFDDENLPSTPLPLPVPTPSDKLNVNEDNSSTSQAEEVEEDNAPTEKLSALVVPKRRPDPAATNVPETPSVVPAPRIPERPAPTTDITPQQEQTLQYMEQKRVITSQVTAVKSTNGHKTNSRVDMVPTVHLAAVQNRRNVNPPLPLALVGGGFSTLSTPRTPRSQRRKKLLLRYISRRNMRQGWTDEGQSSRRFWVTLISTILGILIVTSSILAGGGFVAYRFYTDTNAQFSEEVHGLSSLLPRDNLKMYDRNGALIGQMLNDGVHTSVEYDQIPEYLLDATVAIEDKSFWDNAGVDLLRILRVTIDNLQQGSITGGGSTITQQLIKNLVLQNQKQTMLRKLQELVLTPELNNLYSKEELLSMYVNSSYYGEQAYGINAAAMVYFGLEDKPDKPAVSQLTLAQSALLAGIPNQPSAFNPWINREAALTRMEIVLDSMANQGLINYTSKINALEEANQPDFFKRPASIKNRAPHFFDYVIEELTNNHTIWQELGITETPTRAQIARSGLKVYTTLDLRLNDMILPIAQAQVEQLRDRNVNNSSQVLIDYRTGAILALQGSIDYNSKEIDGTFNVATQGYRQMGSSFKPYVYATAFEQGYSPGQAVNDVAVSFPQPGSANYEPLNYDRQFHGHMTLRCGLQNSLNIPAVKTIEKVGVDAVIDNIKKLGIDNFQGTPGLSSSLGSLEMLLLDHVSAFGTFANGGLHQPHYAIEKIEFTSTAKTFGHNDNAGEQVFSSQVAFMISDVLSDNASRIPQFGPCSPLVLSRGDYCTGEIIPAAVKTGTTNDFKDVLTVGYTSEFILGVWVGNNNATPMDGITGLDGSAPLWHDAMIALMEGREARGFENPGGLERVQQTYADGVSSADWALPGKITPANPPSSATTPANNDNNKNRPKSQPPYCGHYSFAFNPPGSNNTSRYPAWW